MTKPNDGRVDTYGTTAIYFASPNFTATVSGLELSAPSIAALRKKIDASRTKKVEAEFKPFKMLQYWSGSYSYGTPTKPHIDELTVVGVRIEKPHRTRYGRSEEQKVYVLSATNRRNEPREIRPEKNNRHAALFPLSARKALEAYAEAEWEQETRHKAEEKALAERFAAIDRKIEEGGE